MNTEYKLYDIVKVKDTGTIGIIISVSDGILHDKYNIDILKYGNKGINYLRGKVAWYNPDEFILLKRFNYINSLITGKKERKK